MYCNNPEVSGADTKLKKKTDLFKKEARFIFCSCQLNDRKTLARTKKDTIYSKHNSIGLLY